MLLGWENKATLLLRPFQVCCASASGFQLFLIRPPDLSVTYLQKHLVAKQEKLNEEIAAEFCLQSISFTLRRLVLHAVKS
jgi:hypothetical protein